MRPRPATSIPLTPRDWRLLPWALWTTDRPLADNRALLDAYAMRLRNPSRGDLRNLIAAYLQGFAPGRPALQELAALLHEGCAAFAWPWRERRQLFSVADAPAHVCRACMEHPDGVHAALRGLGLERTIASGLAIVALELACTRLERALTDAAAAGPALLERVCEWATSNGDVGARGALADALLVPFAERDADEPMRERIEDLLQRHYRDPRLAPS